MLKLKDIKDKIIDLEKNQYNGSETDAETIEKLRWHLINAARLLIESDWYDDDDMTDEEFEKLLNWF